MSVPDRPIPNLPARAPSVRPEHGEAFDAGAAHYDRVRPGYPDAAVDFLLAGRTGAPAAGLDVVEVGAGTGILTAQLIARGAVVTAVDPSAGMLEALGAKLPAVRRVRAGAEATGLPAASCDVVVCAQAWHWVDPTAATAEALRLLRPTAGERRPGLGLVWNQLDVTVPWVHRLARIMHAGDVHRPEFEPAKGEGLGVWDRHEEHWTQSVTAEFLIELAKSRAYYLRSPEGTRAKVVANLEWYLYEHLGFDTGQELELPYFTHAWRAEPTT
ncbi:class I SAM-dependent methyltransferase [Zhihengliuella halotolerans]|uniref:Methyltransferase family protein n=1 Tax=Zhihengliuella halotolerans TaxID=370736 RepID=A0A4Q8ACK8_9MICC|nr:class I SAM-dependent methyltransferase [Zhihengliuella halotolerans]RZU61888.1 methyltransferase family protein [Zhihengliuella halotolerans]